MQRYFSKIKENEYFILSNDDIHHITKVMRMKNEDEVEIVNEEKVYICSIENVNKNIRFKIKFQQDEIEKNKVEIILAIPLLKEQKMDYIFQKGTELGVKKFIPIITKNSIIKINKGKEENKLARWNRICKEASEQAKRVDIPAITDIKTIEQLDSYEAKKYICSTTERHNSLKNALNKNKDYAKLLLVIGPEGGLTYEEEEKLVSMSFEKVTLGSNILRAETVPLYLASVINYQYME
ncbi:MAG: RsmE family RNA methyltransferase [Mycoplasmatota bacterium]